MCAMGITMGHAKQLLRVIRQLNEAETSEESNMPLGNKGESIVKDTETCSEMRKNGSHPGLKRREPHDSSLVSSSATDHQSCSKIPKKLGTMVTENAKESSNQPSCSSQSLDKNKVPEDVFSRYPSIRRMLEDHPQGPKILKALDNTQKPFGEKARRNLIQKMVAELIIAQNNNNYPPDEAKLALAVALIDEFPRLKNRFALLGYEHYFHPETKKGYITTRLRQIQRQLPISEKKYNTSRNRQKTSSSVGSSTSLAKIDSVQLLPEKELIEIISIMKRKDPTNPDHIDTIKKLMMKSFYNRRNWILEAGPSVTEVLESYIHLKSFHGDMVDKEFSIMHKNKGDSFIAEFPSFYEERLIRYANFENPRLLEQYADEKNRTLKALFVLSGLLPVRNLATLCKSRKYNRDGKKNGIAAENEKREQGKIKSKTPDPLSYLLKISTDGTDPHTYVTNVRKEDGSSVQPYLLGLGPATNRFYFVVADNAIFSHKDTTDIVSAFDLLFKVFQVFNLDYPPQILYFYHFIESFIYKCRLYSEDCITSLHVALHDMGDGMLVEECTDSDSSSTPK
ncbi:hypothetical protein QAD02_008654 [Eretmocerus hayati]|uniref:Uncharacterized protein n=1 Tax=Eretmocerus hayati TaxID=131215 RepID=A0ACC2N754_9HYME|nr:hypothetical protein QAD02_008654 [Eretmocerus hayati]